MQDSNQLYIHVNTGKVFRKNIYLFIHNKMNTVYTATLQSGGGVTIHMKIFHKPKRKKENFSKTRKSNSMVDGSENVLKDKNSLH